MKDVLCYVIAFRLHDCLPLWRLLPWDTETMELEHEHFIHSLQFLLSNARQKLKHQHFVVVVVMLLGRVYLAVDSQHQQHGEKEYGPERRDGQLGDGLRISQKCQTRSWPKININMLMCIYNGTLITLQKCFYLKMCSLQLSATGMMYFRRLTRKLALPCLHQQNAIWNFQFDFGLM